jgi:LuxR family transcriptional regulator, maltose regulon positive regulatory protein
VEASLLATKTVIPPARPRLVSRPRLIERLQEGLGYDLVLVSAPAGFGKTTLVSEWAREDRLHVRICWLSLDEADSDPVRFFEYLILTLQGLLPGLGEKIITWLHSPQPPPARSVLTALMNDLVALPEDVVLVLDDFQFVTSSDVHDAVSYLLDHLPPRLHLLIATRADPSLSLARLRGRGQMLELGADDLRFTFEEATHLLEELRGSELSPAQVAALNARTEGWAVGLKMAALSLGEQKDVSAFIGSFTGNQRHVTDYLVEEVLKRQSTDIQDFLLKTSLLERLTAPLCDAITGRSDSGTLLPVLERANLLLVPLDESREWFRYEHLFADLLRHQLTKAVSKDGVAEIHRRASAWYQANGFPREAIDHALVARDWETAADLLTEVAPRYLSGAEMATLQAWLDALPADTLLARPTLCDASFWTLTLVDRLDEAETLLDRWEPTVGGEPEQRGRTIAYRSVLEDFRGDWARSTELAQQALPLLPASDTNLRSGLTCFLGKACWARGRIEQAETLLWEAHRDAMKAQVFSIAIEPLVYLVYISRSRGNLSRALELCDQALAVAPGSPTCALAHFPLAAILYERNELEAALAHNTLGLDLSQLLGNKPVHVGLLWQGIKVAIALGDEAGALQALERFDEYATHAFGRDHPYWQALPHAHLAICRGDLDEASRCEDLVLRVPTGVNPVDHMERFWPLIALLGILGRREELSRQIERLRETTGIDPPAPEFEGWSIQIRTAQALTASDPEEALGFLVEALRAGEPEGWIRSFVDLGPRLSPLLRRAASRGICPDYAAKLLTIIEMEERRKGETGRSARSSQVYALLTERELEVLRLVGTGLSNRQIAGKLFISLGTVKAHLYNISKKLNAANRAGAYARAKELRLL